MSVDELIKDYPVTLKRDIEWGHLDAYRHVNNTIYFRFFEIARIALFECTGFGKLAEEAGVGPILASTSCRFKLPLTFPDTVTIGSRVDPSELGEDRFTMRYVVVSHTHQAVAAIGEGLIVSYDYINGCKAPLPDNIRQAILDL
jgi:acyl-CoA thioester hydrolase